MHLPRTGASSGSRPITRTTSSNAHRKCESDEVKAGQAARRQVFSPGSREPQHPTSPALKFEVDRNDLTVHVGPDPVDDGLQMR